MPTNHTDVFLKVCLICSALILMLGCQSKADRRYEQLIRDLESSDVEKDAEEAVNRKDFRFVGIYGYSIHLPTVPDEKRFDVIDEYGVRPIDETSDAIESETHGRLQNVTVEYARKYNAILTKHLKESGTWILDDPGPLDPHAEFR
jgi:hypothetical protein